MKRSRPALLLPALVALVALAFVAAACDPPAAPAPAPSASAAPPPPDLNGAGPWASALPPEPSASASAAPTGPVPTYAPGREVVAAAHVLVAYKGAAGAPPTLTRTRDAARKRAEEARAKLLAHKATFEELVTQYTDDTATKPASGAVGAFERYAMPGPFADAAFALEVGAVSEVVETPRGFHLIRRLR